jgi:putative transposase
MKLIYLGLRNISSKRGGESGTGTHGWKTALNTLLVLFLGRLPLRYVNNIIHPWLTRES